LPMVFDRAEGVFAWDPEGKRYFDFLSAYSAVNQGHCHPKIVNAMIQQAQKCTLSSRAFYNSVFPRFARFVTEYFGFEMVLPMNSGAEGVETALKLARKWGYDKKGIPENQAIIVSAKGCFHGRSITNISLSDDPDLRSRFGPFMSGLIQINYNSVEELKEVLDQHGTNICGFIVEPIQGEAGIFVPDDGYIKKCYDLCKQHNVLFIADEIQKGCARTGKMICCEWDNVHPDILILGKAISGGLLPLSVVLSSKEIMLVIKPGEHGSTFGGNPLASAVGIAALEVLKDEKLAERAQVLGERFRQGLIDMKIPFVTTIRGRGLLNAIVIDSNFKFTAWEICLLFKERGLLAKPTHKHIIRLAPPLVITEKQIDECLDIIESVFDDISSDRIKPEDVPLRHM